MLASGSFFRPASRGLTAITVDSLEERTDPRNPETAQNLRSEPMNLRTTVSILLLLVASRQAQATIYEWAISGGSVVQSTTPCPDGAGVSAAPNAYLSGRNLTQAYLIDADLSYSSLSYGTTLTNADLAGANLTNSFCFDVILSNANLTNANLTGAYMEYGTVVNATLTGAIVAGADFSNTNLTPSQLYTTASYRAGNLQGIGLAYDNLSGWNLSN